MNNFQSRLKSILEIKGISQSDLAKLMNTQRSTVSQWISGRNTASAIASLEIAKKLDINLLWLLGEDVPLSNYSSSVNNKACDNKIINRIAQLHEEDKKRVQGYIDGLVSSYK